MHATPVRLLLRAVFRFTGALGCVYVLVFLSLSLSLVYMLMSLIGARSLSADVLAWGLVIKVPHARPPCRGSGGSAGRGEGSVLDCLD